MVDAGEPSPNDDRPPKKSDTPGQESASWNQMAGVGVEFIASVGVCAAVGWWLDGKLATTPWLLIAGCGLGFAIGLWQMIKVANRFMK